MSLNKKEFKFYLDCGIVIKMKVPDHSPPHVHAYQGGNEDLIFIESLKVHKSPSNLSAKQLKICKQWIEENRELLMTKWNELEKMGLISVSGDNNRKTR